VTTIASSPTTHRPTRTVPRARPLAVPSIPQSKSARVATALGKGVVHAPAGIWHAGRDMVASAIDHPVITGSILAGSIALTAAVPSAAGYLLLAGMALAGVSVGMKLHDAVTKAISARTKADMDKAAHAAGDAYGDFLFNGALFALPYAAGRIASARGKAYMEQAIAQAAAEVPAGPAKGGKSTAQALKFLESALESPADELAKDAARTFEALPRTTRKQIMRLLTDPAFVSGKSTDRAAMLLDALGPGFTKLAQVYSEADGVPEAVAQALKVSRDAMKPMPQTALHDILSRHGDQNLGDLLHGVYRIGDGRYKLEKLLGVASIGEVHLARDVDSGMSVVLKVRKPGATPEAVGQEFKFMETLLDVGAKHGRLTEPQVALGRQSLRSFRKGVMKELDLGLEARNAKRFNAAYKDAGFDGVTIRHASKAGDLLVMDMAQGVPFSKLDTLPAAERQEAMLAYLRAMLRQVFDGYFHADPHPGNVFWNSATKRIQFIDMGAMGETTPRQQIELAEMLLTSLSRNSDAMAEMMMRTAEKITSTLPRDELQAKLAAEIDSALAQHGRGGDLNRQTMDLMKAAQRLGVWPKDNGFWFNKTLFTVATTVDQPTQQLFMAEALPKILTAVRRTAMAEPSTAGRMLMRVAKAASKQPQEFMSSLIVQSRANPDALGKLPRWAVRAGNEFALPGRILTLDVRRDP
jgi:predicted unusual protein kinase regulating ubiquinone biosynthesis (AarF/ABC1/UbiB family)